MIGCPNCDSETYPYMQLGPAGYVKHCRLTMHREDLTPWLSCTRVQIGGDCYVQRGKCKLYCVTRESTAEIPATVPNDYMICAASEKSVYLRYGVLYIIKSMDGHSTRTPPYWFSSYDDITPSLDDRYVVNTNRFDKVATLVDTESWRICSGKIRCKQISKFIAMGPNIWAEAEMKTVRIYDDRIPDWTTAKISHGIIDTGRCTSYQHYFLAINNLIDGAGLIDMRNHGVYALPPYCYGGMPIIVL